MSIKDLSEKIKSLGHFRPIHLGTIPDDLFMGLVIVLIGLGAFGLGRLSKIEGSRTPIRIENEPAITADTFAHSNQKANSAIGGALDTAQTSDNIVASKSGTKYYYSWCGGVQKIAVANRIYFASPEQAKAAGYTPSSTCKGL